MHGLDEGEHPAVGMQGVKDESAVRLREAKQEGEGRDLRIELRASASRAKGESVPHEGEGPLAGEAIGGEEG